MCGIAGKIYFHWKIEKVKEFPLIEKSLDKIHHRGPDDKGYYIDRNVWLGATRLKIIDLSPAGHQPFQNENKSLSMVFNGEIYNWKEIKGKLRKQHKFISHTDAEVLLHLYEEEGINCLKYLRGMFAFAIWDKTRKELFIALDRIGKKPVKYYYNDKFFVFASELKAFIDHPGVSKEIDWEAIDEFLTCRYVPSPKTGFKNVWKLHPAHYMRVKSNGEIVMKKYWQVDFSQKLALSEQEWQKLIYDKLLESVRLRLQSDVPLGVHLSGGVDSSLITALATIEIKKQITTFSIGFEESEYNELSYAQLVAKRYDTDHHSMIVKSDVINILPELIYQYEEPFADPSMLPTWYLMKESKNFMTVALNGDGGDENFAGYPWYLNTNLNSIIKRLPLKKQISSILQNLYTTTKRKDFDTLAKYLLSKRKFSNLDEHLLHDLCHYLPDDLLVKTDITSMAHSLEVRSPFLDQEFIELCAKIPEYLKLRKNQRKYMLKKIAEKFIPRECLTRRKQGFLPPLDKWFRMELSGFIESQLLDKKFLSFNIFKNESVNKLITDHQNWLSNNAYILWTMLCLKNWLEIWFY